MEIPSKAKGQRRQISKYLKKIFKKRKKKKRGKKREESGFKSIYFVLWDFPKWH